MKAKDYLLSFILLTSFATSAQEMDWRSGKLVVPESNENNKSVQYVQYGAFSSFKINDINKFLWKVTISGKRIDLETPVPTELQTLFRLPAEQLTETANSEETDAAVESLVQQEKRIEKMAKAQKLINKDANGSEASESELERRLFDMHAKARLFRQKVQLVSNTIQSNKTLRVQLINLAQGDVTYNEMVTAVDELKAADNPSAQYSKMLKAFSDVEAAYLDVKELDPENTEIEKTITEIRSALKTVQDENPINIFTDVEYLADELKNKKNFTAVAPPVQADGDFINYNVAITPTRTNVLGAHLSPYSFDFDIPVRGGWKTDFSVRPTFSFGKNAMSEKYYFTDAVTDGNVILRERENNNDICPGIAAMMHFYKRSGKDFSWGGMLGVGAGFQTLDDVDASFYSGISFILGKSQKIMLNTGISFLNVDRIKTSQFEADQEYVAAEVAIGDVTEKVLKGSFFLSISYNLTNRVER